MGMIKIKSRVSHGTRGLKLGISDNHTSFLSRVSHGTRGLKPKSISFDKMDNGRVSHGTRGLKRASCRIYEWDRVASRMGRVD